MVWDLDGNWSVDGVGGDGIIALGMCCGNGEAVATVVRRDGQRLHFVQRR